MPEGVPYYPPVKPEVPVADTTAAKIVASFDLAGSFTRGLAAMSQANAARNRAQLEAEQNLTEAALKSRQLDIARENNILDYQVGMKNADALAKWRDTQADIARNPNNPTSLAGRIERQRLKDQDWSEFNQKLSDLDLLNSNPKNPVQFYANKQRLQDEFQFSNDSRIKFALKGLDRVTQQHTVPIIFAPGAGPRQVPVGQIIENLNDPTRREEEMRLLRDNNIVHDEPQKTGKVRWPWMERYLKGLEPTDTLTPRLARAILPEEAPKEVTTYDERIKPFLPMATGVDFSRGTPRSATTAPDTVTASSDGHQTVSADDVAAAAETLHPATDAQKLIDSFKSHRGQPGFDEAAARAYLIEQGIDPSELE